MKKFSKLAMAGVLATGVFFYPVYADNEAYAAKTVVDENIFQWVQSSSRMGYYFNQQQICYKVVDNKIDLDTFVVPILKVYDSIQIKDTLDKRRWRMEPIGHFSDLAGRIEFAELHIPTRTVSITKSSYIDSTWTVIESFSPEITIELDKLSELSLDKIFFSKVMDYALRNQLMLAIRTRSDLTDEVKAQLSKQQDEYILAVDGVLPEKDNKDDDEKSKEGKDNKDKNKKDKDKDKKKKNNSNKDKSNDKGN